MPSCSTWCAIWSGLLLDVGVGKAPPQWAAEVLAARDRTRSAADGAGGRACTSGRSRYPQAFGLPEEAAGPVSAIIPDPPSRAGQWKAAMSWFEKIMPSRIKTERRTRSVPEGLWIKCPACDAVLYRAELERNLYVCPKCSHHMRIGARERLKRFLDEGEHVRDRRRRPARGHR